MSQERWAKRRDEFVETSWLRDLRTRRLERKPSEPAGPPKDPRRSKALTGLRDQRIAAAER